jgi:predicted metal-dependent peptidase
MLRDKINQIWKTNHNWKKELIKIVGQSINPDNARQAYAHKNTLISQDRVARTDKDKYDTTDFMMVWIDSSGSMSDDQLKMCLREVYHVALAKKPIKLVVVQCDAAIQDIIEYTNLQQLKNDTINAVVKGRGGTELGPCWKLIQKDPKYCRRPADLVMIFTDGCLKQYKRDPLHMKNLCWVILDNTNFELEYKDRYTKCVHMSTSDIK